MSGEAPLFPLELLMKQASLPERLDQANKRNENLAKQNAMLNEKVDNLDKRVRMLESFFSDTRTPEEVSAEINDVLDGIIPDTMHATIILHKK